MIINPLKVWVQNILPVVYDDSLSYLEIVAKINAKTNEIITQTNENTHAIETLASVIAELGDIDELRALLDEIKEIIENLYTTDLPLMDGTANAGTANHAARSDHVHPKDTSRAPTDHASTNNQYGVGNTTKYGHVKLTDNIDNNNSGTAIAPSAVKTIANKVNTYSKANLLDNWYFVNPVNQRGLSSWINPEYTIDRWKLTSGTAELTANGLLLNGTLVQILENSVGQPVTCSALLSTGSMITPTYDDSTKTFTITATGQTIIANKLEIGTEQTLAHLENNAWVLNELPAFQDVYMRCLRFFQMITSKNANAKIGTALMYRTGRWSVEIPLLAPMIEDKPTTVNFSGIGPTLVSGDNDYSTYEFINNQVSGIRISNCLNFNVDDSASYQGSFINGLSILSIPNVGGYLSVSRDL